MLCWNDDSVSGSYSEPQLDDEAVEAFVDQQKKQEHQANN